MAQLFVPTDSGDLAVLELERREYALPLRFGFAAQSELATLVPLSSGDDWALVVHAGAPARLNGNAIPWGLAVLADRDEIALSGTGTLWYSTEILARVAEAPEVPERALHCPRCARPIAPGAPAVRCPGCGVWHHESEDSRCFSYHDAPCTACGVHTPLDGGFRWSPEGL